MSLWGERDYSEYLRTKEWRERRAACLKGAGYRCVVCNSGVKLQAHHRTYERIGSELAGDLTCLCDSCHRAFSRGWMGGPERAINVLEWANEVRTEARGVLRRGKILVAVGLGLVALGIACLWRVWS